MYHIPLAGAQSKIVDGFLFHWVKQTAGAPYLFFIPGACHGAWCYENYFSYFHDLGYNVASVDLPNRGGMPAGDGFLTLSMDCIEKTVAKAIGSIDDIDSFIAVGHSLGALMAGLIAAKSPVVDGLILLTPSPPGQLEGALKIPLADPNTLHTFGGYESSTARFWPHIDDDDLTKDLYAKLTGESPHLMNERFGLTVHVPWTESKCPALVIEAELEDPQAHPQGQDEKVADFYQGDYIFMNNMGHCLTVGAGWQEGAEHIHNWCQKNKIFPLRTI